ncbi:MAG: DNA primase [Verrucomicrobiota bacterium]|nr:DNA primase [Verrucomicrobiota bacterium]
MPLTRRCIEDIKRRASIVDVVSRSVSLKSRGRDFWGLSPFKSEKSPSFKCSPERNLFYCFSTSQGGDVIKYVMLTENLTFYEAAEALANRFNIPLEYEDGTGPSQEERTRRRQILDIHEQMGDFYHRWFIAADPQSERIREFWTKERRFPMELAEEFKVGYAPVDGGRIAEWLTKKGFSLDALAHSGLFYPTEHARSPSALRPRFRGRLMIPIRDIQGQIVAFTARKNSLTPEDDPTREAKYVNSPETELFHKTHIVFNLDRASKAGREAGAFIVVEGQLDTLRCWHAGVKNTVAFQGSAVTEEQLRLIHRFAPRLDSLLDGDEAGQKAALRLLPIALKVGLEPRFMLLPKGQDPDSLLRDGGIAALEPIRAMAFPALAFAARAMLPTGRSPSPQEIADISQRLFEILAGCEHATAQTAYLNEVVHYLRVDGQALKRDFEKFMWQKSKLKSPTPATPPFAEDPGISTPSRLTTAEGDLLYFVLHHAQAGTAIAEKLDCDWIDTSSLDGLLLSRIVNEIKEDTWNGVEDLELHLTNDAERNRAYALLAEDRACDNFVLQIADCLKRIFLKFVQRELLSLNLQTANLPVNAPEYLKLIHRRSELARLRLSPPDFTLNLQSIS